MYPHAKYQPCVVHVMRNILAKVRVQHRNIIATEIKEVFHAKDKQEAEQLFMKFTQNGKISIPT
uniref:transposase n=1 Tax=Thermospira aquatica TaxID=2828656 RepID=UPI0038CD19D1